MKDEVTIDSGDVYHMVLEDTIVEVTGHNQETQELLLKDNEGEFWVDGYLFAATALYLGNVTNV